MRYLFLLAPVLLSLAIASCGSDDPTDPGPTQPTPAVAEGTIGPAGGQIGNDDISLNVPPGAFATETELKIYAETDSHPFEQDISPVYRLEGVPEDLGQSLTLRFRFLAEKDDGLVLLRGETRDSRSEGLQHTWQVAAFEDSSSWCITEIQEGPHAFGQKSVESIYLAMADGLIPYAEPDAHFSIWYRDTEMTQTEAASVLADMEEMFDTIYENGFHFGAQDTIWPLHVYMIRPPDHFAAYYYGRDGKGFFQFPSFLIHVDLFYRPVLIHEIFHCAQQWFDPRPSSEWIKSLDSRLWLDEASSSFVEMTEMVGFNRPGSMNTTNFKAPLAGFTGHPILPDNLYGYGMSSFIYYMLEHQGEDSLLDLFTSFAISGDAVTALQDILDPAPDVWTYDFHQELVACEIFDFGEDVNPFDDIEYTRLNCGDDTIHRETLSVPDFGSALTAIRIDGAVGNPDAGSMRVRASGDFEISIWGIDYDSHPVLLAAGPDSLTIGDLANATEPYEFFMIMLTKPWADAGDWTGQASVPIEVEMLPPFSLEDYEHCEIRASYLGIDSEGSSHFHTISFDGDGQWDGNTFAMEWDETQDSGSYNRGEATVTVDPQTLAITAFSGNGTNFYANSNITIWFELAGGAIAMESHYNNSYLFRVTGEPTCDTVTHIYYRKQIGEDVATEYVDFACDEYSTVRIELEDLR